MIATRVTVQGFQDILKAYGNAGVTVTKELDIAMRKSTLKLKGTAIIEAPVGANAVLKKAIYSRIYGGGAGLTGEVGVGPAAPYALAVHDGSKPHMPPVDAIRKWASKKLGNPALAWPIAMHIKKHGTKANPFMDRAWEKEQANINAFFEAAQANIAKQIGGS